MIAEKYDPHHNAFWITIPGLRPQRFAYGHLVCYRDDALRAIYGGWHILDARMRPDGTFIALVRKMPPN